MRRLFSVAFWAAFTAGVRETVAGIFVTLGWAGASSSLVLSVASMIWGFVTGVGIVNVASYGLASFLLVASVITAVRGGLRSASSTPPSTQRADSLSLAEIACEWSKEVLNKPGAWSYEKILHELFRALWRGDFENDSGNSKLTLDWYRDVSDAGKQLDKDGRRSDTWPQLEWSRRMLLAVMPPVQGVTLPSRKKLLPARGSDTYPWPGWSSLKKEVPWESLLALEPSEYDDIFREVYLERLRIKKPDFKRWAEKNRFSLPSFWFRK